MVKNYFNKKYSLVISGGGGNDPECGGDGSGGGRAYAGGEASGGRFNSIGSNLKRRNDYIAKIY
ncbi:MAG: hypothetical protein WC781_05790 [Candidatus Pacearchaeota archaeon]|jgi:hypothetical protein